MSWVNTQSKKEASWKIQLFSLQKLSLVKCNLMDVDLTESNRFPKLEHLNLLDNEITRVGWTSKKKYQI